MIDEAARAQHAPGAAPGGAARRSYLGALALAVAWAAGCLVLLLGFASPAQTPAYIAAATALAAAPLGAVVGFRRWWTRPPPGTSALRWERLAVAEPVPLVDGTYWATRCRRGSEEWVELSTALPRRLGRIELKPGAWLGTRDGVVRCLVGLLRVEAGPRKRRRVRAGLLCEWYRELPSAGRRRRDR